MSNTKNTNTAAQSVALGNDAKFDQTVEVLYQKMGDRWFAFSEIDGEIFIGSISQAEIETLDARNSGNSGGIQV